MTRKDSQANEAPLDRMLQKATSFLIARQETNGSWKDFLTPAGYSDEWVSGYTGLVLAESDMEDARAASLRAWTFLSDRVGPTNGWGYNSLVPADADSTVWALQLGSALEFTSDSVYKNGIRFLEKHSLVGGGFTTYHDEMPIRRFLNLPTSIEFSGWQREHVSVTAAIGKLTPFRNEVARFLSESQGSDGNWSSYWWIGDEYSTTLALEVLSSEDEQKYGPQISRAICWLEARLEDATGLSSKANDLNAFKLAWLLRGILSARENTRRGDLIEKCLTQLSSLHQPDGSWKSGARLRIPRPNELNPAAVRSWTKWEGWSSPISDLDDMMNRTFNIVTNDLNSIFTTASVLSALIRCKRNRTVIA